MILIGDTETDGLHDSFTKMHCAVFKELNKDNWFIFTDGHKANNFLKESCKVLIGHNFLDFDMFVFNKLFNGRWTPYSIGEKKVRIIDSLALSRMSYPDRRFGHGLDAWGKALGIKKPEIENWKDLCAELYIHRCKEDVKINEAVYNVIVEEHRTGVIKYGYIHPPKKTKRSYNSVRKQRYR